MTLEFHREGEVFGKTVGEEPQMSTEILSFFISVFRRIRGATGWAGILMLLN